MLMNGTRTVVGVTLAVVLVLMTSTLAITATTEAGSSAVTDLFPEISAPGHSATLLPDGRVLLIGAGSSARAAYLWDPVTGDSERAGALEEQRDGHTATLLEDGRVLVVGGRNALVDAVVWDPSTLTFSDVDGVPKWWRLTGHSVTPLPDGRVLIVGGEDYDTIAGAELWAPGTDEFSRTGGKAARRTDHTATLLPDGRVLIVGGWDDVDRFEDPLGDAVLWDPVSGGLSPAGMLLHARSGHTATLLPDGRVLIIGGADESGAALASAEVWDPGTETFGPAGTLGTARTDHTASLLPDRRVLVVGGWLASSGPLSSVEAWDPAGTSFGPAGSLAEPRFGHTATLLPDGRVLVVGGETPYEATAEIWDPTTRSSEVQPAVTPRPTRFDIEFELGEMIEGAKWQPYRKSPASAAFDPFEYGARTGVIFNDLIDDLYPTIDYVVLFRFDDAADLERYWDDRVEAAAKQAPEREGPCADGEPGRGVWDKGELLCYVSGSGSALLRWTDEEAMTYGVANAKSGRKNLKALHRQWQAALGGIVTGVDEDAAEEVGFNAKERVLLERIPSDIAATCKPRRSQNPNGTVAAVRCQPGNPIVREITYYLLPMKQADRVFNKRVTDAIGDDSDAYGGDCGAGQPMRTFGVPFGRFACYRDDGRATLASVDSANGCKQLDVDDQRLKEPAVYISVQGKDRNIAKLYDWGERVLWKDVDQPGVPDSSLCPAG